MQNQTHIRLELGIDARKFIQQIQINNEAIEDQISKGINLAIEDIAEGDNFIQSVREATKNELALIVNKSVMSWEVQNSISKIIAEKFSKKIEEYADKIADQITSTLK